MGASNQSILYAQPITEKPQGETSIYRHPDFKNELIEEAYPGGKTLKDIFIHAKETYGNKNAVGTIQRTQNEQKINYMTYNEFFNTAHALGSALINEELFNQDKTAKMNFIGIFSKNRVQWSVVDFAGILFKLVTIPIYDTLGDENISYVLKHVSLKVLFVDNNAIKSLKKTQDLDKLQVLISFDPLEVSSVQYFKEKNIKLLSYADLLEKGKQKLVDFQQQRFNVTPEDCVTFSYTSGTTGPPKGSMMSHRNFASFCGAAFKHKDFKVTQKDVILCYLPLPHILERQFLYVLFCYGGEVVYYSGDIAKIKDDLALVKPTIFARVLLFFLRFITL